MATPDLSFLDALPGQNVSSGVGGATGAAYLNPNASGNHGQITESGGFDSATDPTLLAQLKALQQYDPNASIQANSIQQGGGDNQITKTAYNLSYNQDLLPKAPTSTDGQLWARSPQNFLANYNQQASTGQGSNALYSQDLNTSKDINSVYGTLTPGSNVTTTQVPTKASGVDVWGPAAVGLAAMGLPSLFSGLTAGGAASAGAAFGGAGGFTGGIADAAAGAGGASTTGALGNAVSHLAQSLPSQAASGNFNPTSLAGVATGAAGLPSWVATLIQQYPTLAGLLKNNSTGHS